MDNNIEITLNPEILDTVETTTLENMRGLFGDLRTALKMMQSEQENEGSVDEEDFNNLVERANEKLAGMRDAFEIFELVFGCAFGASEEYEYDGGEDDESWVDELIPTPVDDYDRDPETGEMYDPETE